MTVILALDQGTTSSRAIVIDSNASMLGVAQKELKMFYPKPGWVEQDPLEIWSTQLEMAREALALAKSDAHNVAAIGITNQRETVVLWDRETGRPVHNAIGWQDRRTAAICEQLRTQGAEPLVTSRTSLLLDPYFSGTKLQWLLDNVYGARSQA